MHGGLSREMGDERWPLSPPNPQISAFDFYTQGLHMLICVQYENFECIHMHTYTHTRVYIVCLCLHAPMWKPEQGVVCLPVLCTPSQFLRQISP